jgi:AcrR family transcriptional regulator
MDTVVSEQTRLKVHLRMIKDLPLPLRTIDKRIQRTKMKLLDSFVSLIIERGYANVTVQDIIHRAKVGRSTFYAHFENKEHVLKGDNMLRLLLTDKKFSGTTVKCEIDFLRLYNHVKENRELAKEVFGSETGAMMKDHVKNIMIFALQSYLKNRLRTDVDKVLLSIMLESTGSALMAMLIGWAVKGMPVSTRTMADKSRNIVDNFFKDFVK